MQKTGIVTIFRWLEVSDLAEAGHVFVGHTFQLRAQREELAHNLRDSWCQLCDTPSQVRR